VFWVVCFCGVLPEGIEEVLPPRAYDMDLLYRKIVDQFDSWGYDLVMPPLIEYLDSLLTGTGEDLDLKTFKITDQLTGKLMGIRADITPQVARIDSSILNRDTPVRLCYFGTILHTLPGTLAGTRAPMQVGAELFGHSGVESDAEILSLMLKTLQIAGIKNAQVEIGHVGIYRTLIKKLNLTSVQKNIVSSALHKKSKTELKSQLDAWSVSKELSDALVSLINLYGDKAILNEARNIFASIDTEIVFCIDELEKIAELTLNHVKDASLMFDLADIGGYKYHNGMIFTAYMHGQGQGIAFGGRYDGIGEGFGRARPATGFSTDVKLLFDLISRPERDNAAIFAPGSNVPGLYDAVNELRDKGERVIYQLTEQVGDAGEMGCDRELYLEGGRWKVRNL
jgi:ATP phosphoribosyltransferase regulatory subunit